METSHRPAIPAEVRRRVLVEAGHRCAIPTCRHLDVDVHHIVPWKQCRSHEYQNLIALCPNCHRRADRGEIDRKSLRAYKASLRFTHDRFSQFEVDVLFEAYKLSPGHLQYPPFMRLLIKRLLEAKFVTLQDYSNVSGSIAGMQVVPQLLGITPEGRAYVESLGIEDKWSEDE